MKKNLFFFILLPGICHAGECLDDLNKMNMAKSKESVLKFFQQPDSGCYFDKIAERLRTKFPAARKTSDPDFKNIVRITDNLTEYRPFAISYDPRMLDAVALLETALDRDKEPRMVLAHIQHPRSEAAKNVLRYYPKVDTLMRKSFVRMRDISSFQRYIAEYGSNEEAENIHNAKELYKKIANAIGQTKTKEFAAAAVKDGTEKFFDDMIEELVNWVIIDQDPRQLLKQIDLLYQKGRRLVSSDYADILFFVMEDILKELANKKTVRVKIKLEKLKKINRSIDKIRTFERHLKKIQTPVSKKSYFLSHYKKHWGKIVPKRAQALRDAYKNFSSKVADAPAPVSA